MSTSQKGQYILQNGNKAHFNHLELRNAIIRKAQVLGISRQELMENITEEIGVSYSAMKHWIQGHNAPSDIDKVRDIADSLGISPDTLFTEKEAENMNTNNNPFTPVVPAFESEKDAIRSIYNHMVEFIEAFRLGTNTTSDNMQNLKEVVLHLMKIRLDVSEEVFLLLRSFAVNYLQQMVIADKLFGCCFAEEDNGLDSSELHKDFEEFDGLKAFFFEPWLESCNVNLDPVYRPNMEAEDAKLATKAIGADWTALDEGDPFVPFFYLENLIEGAHKRLNEILSRYRTE